MKTERRHELKTNDLAHQIEVVANRVKPYSSLITLGLVVLLAAMVVTWVLSNRASQRGRAAWEAYFQATDPAYVRDHTVEEQQEKLRDVAKAHAGTAMEEWAQLAAADQGMRYGARLLLADKNEARKYLNACAADYQKLKEDARSLDVRQQATYDLALTYEMLSQLDKASEEYENVTGPLAAVAHARAKELKENQGLREFYDWYVKAEPAAMPKLPGTPGHVPPFDVDEPSTGQRPGRSSELDLFPSGQVPVKLPSNIEDDLPEIDLSKPVAPAPPEPSEPAEKKAGDEPKPAEKAPPGEPGASEKKAADEPK